MRQNCKQKIKPQKNIFYFVYMKKKHHPQTNTREIFINQKKPKNPKSTQTQLNQKKTLQTRISNQKNPHKKKTAVPTKKNPKPGLTKNTRPHRRKLRSHLAPCISQVVVAKKRSPYSNKKKDLLKILKSGTPKQLKVTTMQRKRTHTKNYSTDPKKTNNQRKKKMQCLLWT